MIEWDPQGERLEIMMSVNRINNNANLLGYVFSVILQHRIFPDASHYQHSPHKYSLIYSDSASG